MNKFLKLPLFLAIVGGACTTVLATTYAFTNPIIVERELKEKFAASLRVFDLVEADGSTPKAGANAQDLEVPEALTKKGITRKVEVTFNSQVVGYVYEGEVKGYTGASTNIIFQISFKDGNYNQFVCISNTETPSIGGAVLNKIPEIIAGKAADSFTTSSLNADFSAGSTETRSNLIPAIIAAAEDYGTM